MLATISRRRFLAITAAAAGLALAPELGRAADPSAAITWRGVLMGADASLRIHHPDAEVARKLMAVCVAEVRRLEQIFSLYREDSAVSQLNRDGLLVAPPKDLVNLLQVAQACYARTGGAFDPTVQALWTMYRAHFSSPGADPAGPLPATLRQALAKVGLNDVLVDRNRIAFGRKGMQLTFNGIAQGYATDRVVDILRAGGIETCLVDIGEPRAVGADAAGRPWRVGVVDPAHSDRIGATFDVVDRAVATSGGYGFQFDEAGLFNHLLDPRTGRSAGLHQSVTVILASATQADALSTAFSLLPLPTIIEHLSHLPGAKARVVMATGQSVDLD